MSEQDLTASADVDQRETENKLIEVRRQKLAELRKSGQAFPNDFKPTHRAAQLQASHGEIDKAAIDAEAMPVAIAGRVMRNRGAFLVLQDSSGQVQMYVNRKELTTQLLALIKTVDLGDILGISGLLSKSNKGELYIDARQVQILTKSLRPLPDKHKGLSDVELCYRQRYVDLMVNDQTRSRFLARSKLMTFTREFLHAREFIEVETPMLQVVPGGATAEPFVTHHNALDLPMYLRIAPELYLKRLVVGGFERVFEINRNFRNEGSSTRHNPEFTMLELYQAYSTYHDLIELTQDYIRGAAQAVCGSTTLTYQGTKFDLAQPFRVLSMREAILEFGEHIVPSQFETIDAARILATSLGIQAELSWGLGRFIQEIFDEVAEKHLIQPTFITEYPTEVSPLARLNDNDPMITDRFEFFIGGREIGNGFSELNDAEDQAQRFKTQVEQKEAGDNEAMHFDHDYVRALEYGMPPTAGEGIGMDRLVMFLTDAASIRDVILFPHLKPEDFS